MAAPIYAWSSVRDGMLETRFRFIMCVSVTVQS